MNEYVIDTVLADFIEPGDLLREGVVSAVREDEDSTEYVAISIEGEDIPLRLKWDTLVDLMGY